MHDADVLTVLARVVGGAHVLVVFVILYLFDDLVEEIVEKLVGVLMHGATEGFIAIRELVGDCAGSNSALILRILGDVYVKGVQRREESGSSPSSAPPPQTRHMTSRDAISSNQR